MNNSISSTAAGADGRQGWTSSPDGRGTMSIIWSCMVTTFLCCWSVLVINLPEPGSKRWSTTVRKLFLVLLSAAAPEAILQVALGQWLSARSATKLFHESGYSEWSLRHSFFLDMGGLHLRCPDHPPFPINSRQLHYLIMKKYVAYPSIDESQIRDRNKVDGVLRLITLVQTSLFMANVVLRAVQQLEITVLELSTAAFVVVAILVTFFWFFKPADVERCDFIESQTTLETMLVKENVATDHIYNYTPLDFVGREEWSWSILWMHGLNCLRALHLAGQPHSLPVLRFQNTIIPVIRGWYLVFWAIASLAYLGIFVGAWNHSFPTYTEKILWRCASVTAMVSAFGVFWTQQVYWQFFPSLLESSQQTASPITTGGNSSEKEGHHTNKVLDWLRYLRAKINAFLATVHNNSISQDPVFDAPVSAVLITWFFGFFYCTARAYIILADFVEIRSLPTSAYISINWSSLAPYVL